MRVLDLHKEERHIVHECHKTLKQGKGCMLCNNTSQCTNLFTRVRVYPFQIEYNNSTKEYITFMKEM